MAILWQDHIEERKDAIVGKMVFEVLGCQSPPSSDN